MSDQNIEWDYASREDELEAIRWYLTAHLDLQTKLDLQWGTPVNIYEYLRHAVKLPILELPNPQLPNLGKVLKLPMKAIGACEWIWPDSETGHWLKVPEFPQLPFGKLSDSSRQSVARFLDAQPRAFWDMDITELADWGVLDELSELAEVSEHSKERVIAEIEVSPQTSVIAFMVDFRAGVKGAERSVQRWFRENRHRFASARTLVGTRTKDSPLVALKDLAATRLLALHNYNPVEASRWTHANQPSDSGGRAIPWFNNRKAKTKGRSQLFKDLRDWDQAVERFGKNLQAFVCSH